MWIPIEFVDLILPLFHAVSDFPTYWPNIHSLLLIATSPITRMRINSAIPGNTAEAIERDERSNRLNMGQLRLASVGRDGFSERRQLGCTQPCNHQLPERRRAYSSRNTASRRSSNTRQWCTSSNHCASNRFPYGSRRRFRTRSGRRTSASTRPTAARTGRSRTRNSTSSTNWTATPRIGPFARSNPTHRSTRRN